MFVKSTIALEIDIHALSTLGEKINIIEKKCILHKSPFINQVIPLTCLECIKTKEEIGESAMFEL
jgi:hypothetical protein